MGTYGQKINSVGSDVKCLLCKAKHSLFNCNDFKSKTVDQRVKWALSEGICFLCLNKGHTAPSCKSKESCRKCKKRHNSLLHLPNKTASESKELTNTSSNLINTSNNKVLLRILPVKLQGPNGELETFAFLDDGSTLTLVEEEIATKLGIEGPTSELIMQWSNDVLRTEENSQTISLNISGTEPNAKRYYLNNARTVKNLSLPVQSINVEQLSEQWKHLKKIQASSFVNAKPTILIGQDNWPLLVTRNIVHGPWRGPAVSKTLLGWVVHGTTFNDNTRKDVNSQHILHHKNVISEEELTVQNVPRRDCCKELRNLVEKSLGENWEDDLKENEAQTEEDKRAEEIFKATTRRVGDRWETGLLWKENFELPNNYSLAKQRLHTLEKRMDRDKEFGDKYVEKMEEYISKGYATKRTAEEAKECRISQKVWYLPHLGVVNPKKPGKFRICFDAAAKFKGVSLNDTLMKGPDLFVNIVGLIFRFRQHQIAMIADIKEMFPQIIIRHEDQLAQQFLWRGFEREKEPQVYVMRRMIFGAICSPFSAQKVKNENALKQKSQYPEACTAILKDHYMDDYVGSSPTVEDAKKLVAGIINVHSKGGFVICNWISNNKELLDSIPQQLKSTLEKETKVLGLIWDPNEDYLMYETKTSLEMTLTKTEKLPTKREALKLVLQVFDPLGWAALYLSEGKRIMQEIWKSRVDWDEVIPENLRTVWNNWLKNLQKVIDLKIPRCYGRELTDCEEIQLHILCDASEKTYAAVAYVRISKENNIKVSLIASRHRVAPLKPITIPRLELMAAVLGCKLRNVILREHSVNFHRVVMWSDSKTVILWIRNDETKFKTFVANRIAKIKEDTQPQEWKWIPSELNTADYVTRSKDIKEEELEQWFNGPVFLKKHEVDWPKEAFNIKHQTIPEVKRRYVGVTTETNNPGLLPDVERFSSMEKLLNVTAAIYRFAKIWKKELPKDSTVTNSQLEEAEHLWIKKSQSDSFQKEIATIKAGLQLEGSTKLDKLTPFIDESGILRVQGRLGKAKCLTNEAKHPIILDPKHKFTKLLIDQYHRKFLHQGQETVSNELRQRYWIINMRKAVKSSWNRCKLCSLRRAKPVQPKMGELPSARLTAQVTPFHSTGMDYFGPIYITVGRRQEKRYGVIFTCMSIRAIHLEIAHSLTSDSAIMAIRRFISRRGSPKMIYSDNGTNLKKANKELQESLTEIDQTLMTSKLAAEGIEWHFIPPASPHMGGSWERLIRTVKVALEVCLKERKLKDEVLLTVFAEVENVVNSRPLTRVSSDPNDQESITPNHFLIGRSGSKAPCIKIPENICLKKAWKTAQQITDVFWQRWIREYLPQINTRSKWTKTAKPIEEGELVIVAEPNSQRSDWKKGLILKTFPGTDGQVRVVDVKTDCGVFRRPASKICRISVEENL